MALSKNTAYKVQVDIVDDETGLNLEQGTLYLFGDVLKLQTSTITVDLLTTGIGGIPGGYATLDITGKVPASQLPSYVDDVLEFANLGSFPLTGESDKVYIAIDTNIVYRWSGSIYVPLSGAIISVNGYTGVVVLDKNDIGLGNVDNTSDANKPISTATQTALDNKVDKIVGKGLSENDLTNALKSAYDSAVTDSHTHANKIVLDAIDVAFTSALKSNYDSAFTNSHTHTNKTILDNITEAFTTTLKTAYDGAVTNSHTHTNKAILDNITAAFTTTLQTAYDNHLTNTSNPHSVTKSQIGLSAVPNLDTSTTTNITDSTNKRFVTDAEKTTLSNTSGTNTGNQTSIVGITGTKSQFNTAVTDGDFLYVGDVVPALKTKSGVALTVSFAGNPRKATVTFGTAFASANYSPIVTCQTTGNTTFVPVVESILAGSFVINLGANNTNNLTDVRWTAILHGEN